MTLKQHDIDLKYVLGVFNSKLMNFIYRKKFKSTKTVFSEIQARSVGMLPMKVNIIYEKRISSIVSKILSMKKKEKDTFDLENQIDFLVYHLYGLTYDEVLIVDPDTPISREEYEAYKGE